MVILDFCIHDFRCGQYRFEKFTAVPLPRDYLAENTKIITSNCNAVVLVAHSKKSS